MITSHQWLTTFSSEYLDTFIKDGGATVKFVTGEPAELQAVRAEIAQRAAEAGFICASLDGATTKLHFIEQLFHEVARQVDWEVLAEHVRTRAIAESGYTAPSGPPTFAAIAAAAGSTSFLVLKEIHKWFTSEVFRDYHMTQEFRAAMMLLALDPMDNPGAGPGGQGDLLIQWLQGELKLVSALKPAPIFQKVARHNARDTFVSLTHWARLAGRAGLVVTIDISRYTTASPPAGEGYKYTRAAAMDLYEVVRQFIDATDELEGCAIVFLAPKDWPADHVRGLRMYRALEARVAEEVVDPKFDNPLAVLARVGG
ncbi:MAG: DUF2791 family P-loop domain-containing protein [Chloroflexi bacterium]|nr:DUF2791 family P-loop domain-containing protein [Chloroflexota bacterium]